MLTVCYFGIYHPGHPRNSVFLRSLKKAGFNVIEINNRSDGVKKYWNLARELWRNRKKIDVVLVGFPGQQAVFIAKLIFRGPVIFNPLLSLHDAIIGDRKSFSRWSIRALYFWLLDFFSVHLADHVIHDHKTHVEYFSKTFKLRKSKTSVIYMGADEELFQPLSLPEKKYEIHYYSSYIPVHGTDTIIRAAKILENDGITFVISGRGQCYADDRKLADELDVRNVEFTERLKSKEELNQFINSSWISLGLLAWVPRTPRSIASKVFEAMCCGRPIVTAYTKAGAELLKDKESVLFVEPKNPKDLAEKILLLKSDDALRMKIAKGARQAYEEHTSFDVITSQLKNVIVNIHGKD
jgi:glycosyltransferase involved in cell wall biosynthesis